MGILPDVKCNLKLLIKRQATPSTTNIPIIHYSNIPLRGNRIGSKKSSTLNKLKNSRDLELFPYFLIIHEKRKEENLKALYYYKLSQN
jgi:hypothetical protein